MDRCAAPATAAMPVASGELTTTSPEQTRALGRALGTAAVPGDVLALIGPLGAGKTQLTKGVAEGLGVRTVVNSPTFILMNEHPGRLRLFHVDAYRLGDPEEAVAAGLLDERQAAGVTVIEWADRIAAWLPDELLEIVITPDADMGDTRLLRWIARGPAPHRLARAMETGTAA
jgi:tRNA threonylcarbamoyladenosine biosynthesis protein TsaE